MSFGVGLRAAHICEPRAFRFRAHDFGRDERHTSSRIVLACVRAASGVARRKLNYFVVYWKTAGRVESASQQRQISGLTVAVG